METGPKRGLAINYGAAINLVGTQARTNRVHIEIVGRLLEHLDIYPAEQITLKHVSELTRRKLASRLAK